MNRTWSMSQSVDRIYSSLLLLLLLYLTEEWIIEQTEPSSIGSFIWLFKSRGRFLVKYISIKYHRLIEFRYTIFRFIFHHESQVIKFFFYIRFFYIKFLQLEFFRSWVSQFIIMHIITNILLLLFSFIWWIFHSLLFFF